MSSQAFLRLSKLKDTAEIVSVLSSASLSDQLPHYFNALKLIKSINTNEVLHSYLNTLNGLSEEEQVLIYSMVLDAQFGHYIHTSVLLALTKLYYAQHDYPKANEFISQLNINKINPVEWQLDSNGLLWLKYEVYKLLISISDKLLNYDKFDEYLKKIHELLIALSTNNDDNELYQKFDKLHTFLLLKLDKFTEVFRKLYKSNQFNELFYILLLFNINYINEINIHQELKESPFSPVFKRMQDGKLVYYDIYIKCLKYLLNSIPTDDNNDDNDIQLNLTKYQILENFKIVIFKHNLSCISQIYDNISISNLKKILQSDDESDDSIDKEFELSDTLFDKILYDSITSGIISAQVDDIEQIIEFNKIDGESKVIINNDWNEHIVESCLLLDNIVAQI